MDAQRGQKERNQKEIQIRLNDRIMVYGHVLLSGICKRGKTNMKKLKKVKCGKERGKKSSFKEHKQTSKDDHGRLQISSKGRKRDKPKESLTRDKISSRFSSEFLHEK